MNIFPKKWCIKRCVKMQQWQIGRMMNKCNVSFAYEKYYYSPIDESLIRWSFSESIPDGYTEITFEQFEKYILNKDKTMQNEIKIQVPEGMMIDEENSTFTHIKFKPIKKELPKRWEELSSVKGFYVSTVSDIDQKFSDYKTDYDRNVFPTKELAEAALALSQLLQLRDVYNDGWKPDWIKQSSDKYVILCDLDTIRTTINYTTSRVLTFKSAEIRDEFLSNFRDLIEIAKPLL